MEPTQHVPPTSDHVKSVNLPHSRERQLPRLDRSIAAKKFFTMLNPRWSHSNQC
jgi:hypothetical protein